MALGLKGGFALSKSGFTPEVAASLGSAIALAIVIPLVSYFVLQKVLAGFDAAALAATYGSVSASYIAVPAVLRTAIPDAKPSLYFGMSLGVTFPLNLLIGIPAYSYEAMLFIQ